LIGTIYVEPLASHAPHVKETKFFEQEQKNRELEEELEVVFNFLKKTITSTIALTPQVIIILDSKEEVEILSQLVVKK
jgi:hypothetical protein